METPRNGLERVWECVCGYSLKNSGLDPVHNVQGGGGVGGRRVVVWGACASILALGRSKVCYT